MLPLDAKQQALILEALEELMYKVSVQLEAMKGQPMSMERELLTKKQKQLEELQHLLSGHVAERYNAEAWKLDF
jgi:hypothetical protein